MASVHDVAKYIVSSEKPLSPWHLHKLLYYSQAWHLVWEEKLLFRARIEAWGNGPVVACLYPRHKGSFKHLRSWPGGSVRKLSTSERESIDAVVSSYHHLSSWQLSELVHGEAPWKDARHGLHMGERGHVPIASEALASYYGALAANENTPLVKDLKW